MKGKSIVEVLLVFLLVRVLFAWMYRVTDFSRLELSALGWSYVGGIASILVPVTVLLLTRRNLESYGLTLKGWGYNLDVGLTCYLVLLIPYSTFILSWVFGFRYTGVVGSLISGVAGIVAMVAILLILRRRDKSSDPKPKTSKLDLLVLVVLLMLPIFLALYLGRLTTLVFSTVVWQFVFSGFGEEIGYRGYYQSRINQEFGRPYTFLGVKFGPGLIVASLLFAFAHVLNPFSPYEGVFDLDWLWGFRSFIAGLFYGFVKEKTESVVAAGIAHGLPDAVGEAFAKIFSLSL